MTCHDMKRLVQQKWDAIVIGAGPAGAFCAFQLASAGKKVLLLDKAHFPRPKVCGCCLNQSAYRVLQRAGLDGIFVSNGAVPLSSLELFDGAASATMQITGSFALSRICLDTALIRAAEAAGAVFVSGVAASVCQQVSAVSRVQIVSKEMVVDGASDFEEVLESKVTIVADGLNGHSLDRLPEFNTVVAADARFGCGTTFANASASSLTNGYSLANGYYRSGRIYMACQQGGYVGLVVLESGDIDIACALDRSYVRQQGSLALAIAAILKQCDLPLPVTFEEFSSKQWHGTDLLTRRRNKISGQCLFVVGDACGYPEPLTGEGIAWALESAEAVAPLAISAIEQWSDALAVQWQQVHGRLVNRRHLKSRVIAYSLRSRMSRMALIQVVSLFPRLAEGIASGLTRKSNQIASSKW